MSDSRTSGAAGELVIRAVLNCAPVFYTADYWSEGAHRWDGLEIETPLQDKPWAIVEASLDATLGQVLDAACKAWGFEAGPEQTKWESHSHYARIGFVLPEHEAHGVTPAESYRWSGEFPITREDGTEARLTAHEVTYRELLVSSALGYIEGDVTRPILQPSIPQGSAIPWPELIVYGGDVIRATYASLDAFFGQAEHVLHVVSAAAPTIHRDVDEVIDDGTRIAAVAALVKKLKTEASKHSRTDS